MAWVSVASMVVWFTTPTRSKSLAGSKPSLARSRNTRSKVSSGSSPRMMRPSSSASAMSRSTTAGALRTVWLKVARVSSCTALPWMMTVYRWSPSWSLRFQTFSTKGQVVLWRSGSMPFSFSRASVSRVVPKAGMITMSSAVSSSQSMSRLPSVSCTKRMPRATRSSFTAGLWIIWLSRKIRFPGFSSRAL